MDPRDSYFDSFHQTPQGELKNTFYNPFVVKHRRRTSKMQLRVLEKTFETNVRPDASLRKILAEQLGMTPRSVQVWFQNRRAKIKKGKRKDDTKDNRSMSEGYVSDKKEIYNKKGYDDMYSYNNDGFYSEGFVNEYNDPGDNYNPDGYNKGNYINGGNYIGNGNYINNGNYIEEDHYNKTYNNGMVHNTEGFNVQYNENPNEIMHATFDGNHEMFQAKYATNNSYDNNISREDSNKVFDNNTEMYNNNYEGNKVTNNFPDYGKKEYYNSYDNPYYHNSMYFSPISPQKEYFEGLNEKNDGSEEYHESYDHSHYLNH